MAALDSEQKRKTKYNQWFVESCRQFKDIKAETCLAVLNHLEPNSKAAHDTVIPLLSLRLLLCRCLGVKLSFKISALKRQEDQFMEWALVQYTSLCRPLKGWTGWTPEDVWFGQGLVYSLVKPDCENHFGETIIDFVVLNRTGQTRKIGLPSLTLESLPKWCWVNPDCEKTCQIANADIGDAKFFASLYQGQTIALAESKDCDMNDEEQTKVDLATQKQQMQELSIKYEQASFFEALALPPPPPKSARRQTASSKSGTLPPPKKPKAPPFSKKAMMMTPETLQCGIELADGSRVPSIALTKEMMAIQNAPWQLPSAREIGDIIERSDATEMEALFH